MSETKRGQISGIEPLLDELPADIPADRVVEVVNRVADALNWTNNNGRANKVGELLWELGLVLQSRRQLTLDIFVNYVASVTEFGCIPLGKRC